MALQTMYPAGNSQSTQLVQDISAGVQSIAVADVSVFPAAPNYATIGIENSAEVILYTGIESAGNRLTGIERGKSGTIAKSWQIGAEIYHSWTSDNANAIMGNITAGQNSIDTHTQDIAANRQNIGKNTQDISKNTQDITTNRKNITTLQADLSAIPPPTTYTTPATYAGGVFTLTDPLPGDRLITVRFIAPAAYTEGDSLRISGSTVTLLSQLGEALPTDAWAQGVIVALEYDPASQTAFFKLRRRGGEANIVCGLALPETVLEGTIFVIAPEESPAVLAVEPPEPAAEGLVWVAYDDSASTGGEPALKLIAAHIYDGEKWEPVDAYYGHADEWLPLPTVTVVYDYLTGFLASETWTVPEAGWYKIFAWGASGNGDRGLVGARYGHGGAGGASGGFSASLLYLKKGAQVNIGIGASTSVSSNGIATMEATYTASGGNIVNLSGFHGGAAGWGGYLSNTAKDGGTGGNAGAGGGRGGDNRNKDGGGGGGGGRLPGEGYCRYVVGAGMGGQCRGGKGATSSANAIAGGSAPVPTLSPNIILYGGGGGGGGGSIGATNNSSNKAPANGGAGQGGVVIIEKGVIGA